MSNSRQKGLQGEKAAIFVLKKKGFQILEHNFYATYGEIDLIAQEGDTIVFVEVKRRSNEKNGLPREAVNWKKQQRILSAALEYIGQNNLENTNFRFDVMEIMDWQGKLYYNHIKNAFQQS